ncbi:MAG: aminotransferase class V-fold PLP-dependent enzyme [Firmicutes bacterium]|nr:aminotransferase class V-fold PLP-dependent enzyme [Bacillota bacterium]
MKNSELYYFDNAATTFPKPENVINAVSRCMRTYCGNPGRSSHRLSRAASEKIFECRTLLAEMFGSGLPENVVFTYNATYALNIAIKALCAKNSHAIISNTEHNSVYRPVSVLSGRGDLSFDVFDAFSTNTEDVMNSIRRMRRRDTKTIIVSHASNICGVCLPLYEIGRYCAENGIVFIVDASQSAGSHSIDMRRCNIDALCAPSHKGLMGPQGGGFVIFGDKYDDVSGLLTFAEGGNGINSFDSAMPDFLPERFEAGTLATPVIAGLCEGVKTVSNVGTDAILAHQKALKKRFTDRLANTPNITVYAPEFTDGGIVLFNIVGVPAYEAAETLDRYGVCVRSGFHCSPLAHEKLETGENGALRASFSMFNTESEVDKVFNIIRTAFGLKR